jgi:hypothetical protein
LSILKKPADFQTINGSAVAYERGETVILSGPLDLLAYPSCVVANIGVTRSCGLFALRFPLQ